MQKILIVGDAGRGKSTLAKKLSERTNIKVYNTDDFYWETKYTKPRDKVLSKQAISSVYQNESWIIDGSTHDLIKDGLSRADIIVHLRFKSVLLQYLALIKRHFGRSDERFIDLLKLLRHVTYKRYKIGYKKYDETTTELLHSYHDKVVTLDSYKQIENFILNFK